MATDRELTVEEWTPEQLGQRDISTTVEAEAAPTADNTVTITPEV